MKLKQWLNLHNNYTAALATAKDSMYTGTTKEQRAAWQATEDAVDAIINELGMTPCELATTIEALKGGQE